MYHELTAKAGWFYIKVHLEFLKLLKMQLNSGHKMSHVISTPLASLNIKTISVVICMYLMPCVWAFSCTSMFLISQRWAMFPFTHQALTLTDRMKEWMWEETDHPPYIRERRERHRKTEELSLPWHPLLSLQLALIPFSSSSVFLIHAGKEHYRNPWGHEKGPLAIIKILHFILHACSSESSAGFNSVSLLLRSFIIKLIIVFKF